MKGTTKRPYKVWRRRVLALKKYVELHGISHPKYMHWIGASGNWPSCAVGERKHLLRYMGYEFVENNYGNVPLDDNLFNMGAEFYSRLCKGHYDKALDILDKLDKICASKKRSA